MDKPIDLLLIEDSPEDAELVLRALREAGVAVAVERVSSEVELVRALGQRTPELILSDYSMPAFGGGRALQVARSRCPDVPFIFVSGTIGEERAIAALRDGAVDYVLKDNLKRLGPAVRRALEEAAERGRRRAAERALEASDRRFRLFMQHSPSAVAMKDLDGRVAFANTSVERIIGKPATEIVGRLANEVFPWVDGGGLTANDRKSIESNQAVAAIEELPIGDARHSFLVHRFPISDENGRPVMIGVVATDITDRVRQEEKIARLSRIQLLLSGINAMTVRVRKRQELFREACRIAVRHGGFLAAWIGLVEPADDAPRPVASMDDRFGFRDEAALRQSSVGDDYGLAASAVRSGQVAAIDDVASDARSGSPERCAYRSLAAIPLITGATVVGVFVLYAKPPGYFDRDEIALLRELAADISFALDHLANKETLAYVANYDTLTGLANRTLFSDRLSQLVHTQGIRPRPLVTLVFELQRLELVNDSLGRAAGEKLVRAFAGRLQTIVGKSTVARISSDRFAVALEDLQHSTVVSWIEHWTAHELAAPLQIDGHQLHAVCRIGIASYPGDGDSAEALLTSAEVALQRTQDGETFFAFYSAEAGQRVSQRLQLENRLRQAVARKEFVLHYQPKVALRGGGVHGLEALIRWHDPIRGLIPPIEFIETLEASGLIVEVGRWVIAHALADVRHWRSRGLEVPRIAVNVSQVQIRRRDFVETVLGAILAEGLPESVLDLEITESLTMEDTDATIGKLRSLRDRGLRISMDDFGTGYSSLSRIASLPLDEVKIDRAFIARMDEGNEALAIVSAIIKLAHVLRLRVIAEGVETHAQARVLTRLGCDEAQGYLFARPMPAEQIGQMLGGSRVATA